MEIIGESFLFANLINRVNHRIERARQSSENQGRDFWVYQKQAENENLQFFLLGLFPPGALTFQNVKAGWNSGISRIRFFRFKVTLGTVRGRSLFAGR